MAETMVTVKDVAHKAGVSTATVSHVINETRFVSQELRTRVREAMEELDYRPNAIARSLRRKRTQNIGMIVPDVAYPFLAEVARGLEDRSFELGYSATLCESNSDPEREAACIDLLRAKQADGIVFVAGGESSTHVRALIKRRIPVVVCDRELAGVEVDTVVADNVGSGCQGTEHLIRLGHRHIGCIAGPRALCISDKRLDGYKHALKKSGIPLNKDLIAHGDFRCQGGYEAMGELLSLGNPPTAVFTCNDLMAMGAICAASKRRLRIPEDIAIVGCDDIALAAFTNPSLTTIAQPKSKMGALAVDMLIDRIENMDKPPTKRVLPTELVIRDSC
jgi:LacI family transcriptional regulator